MVVDDLHVVCVAIAPSETNAPLVIDANGVLSFPVAFEGLTTIAGRAPQVFKTLRRIEQQSLRTASKAQLPGQAVQLLCGMAPMRHSVPTGYFSKHLKAIG